VEVDGDVDDTRRLAVTDKCPSISSVRYSSCLNRRWARTVTPIYTSAKWNSSSYCFAKTLIILARSSAVAERPRDVSCH